MSGGEVTHDPRGPLVLAEGRRALFRVPRRVACDLVLEESSRCAPKHHRYLSGFSQAIDLESTRSRVIKGAPEERAMNEQNGDAGRVLVVDDEASITDLLSMALRYEKFTVLAAHSGHEALDAVPGFAPDLVVLDIMMPGIDGFEVARRMRNGGSSFPILFLTARDATQDKVRGLTLGGDDYMTKPFSVEELVARIRAILRRVRPASASPGRLSFSRPRDGRGHPPGVASGRGDRAHGDRVQTAALPPAQRAPRALQGPDPRPRLELRLRRQRQHRRNLHQLPAAQDRRRWDPADPHRARRRLQHPPAQGTEGRRRSPVTLRTRLLLALLGLVALGLLVAGVATFTSLRSFLLTRVDQQLSEARYPVLGALASDRQLPGPGQGPGGPRANLPPGTYGALLDSAGTVLSKVTYSYGQSGTSVPKLPSSLPSAADDSGTTIFNASSSGSSSTGFRVLVQRYPSQGLILEVAVPLLSLIHISE